MKKAQLEGGPATGSPEGQCQGSGVGLAGLEAPEVLELASMEASLCHVIQ